MISFETLISLIALVVAIASFLYTWHFNRYSIFLDSRIRENVDGQKYYSFVISNCSSRALVINDVELLNSKNQQLQDNGFVFAEPGDIYSSSDWNSEPFNNPVTLLPYSNTAFSYYLDEYPSTIKVSTNHRIDKLHYSQTFNA